MSAELIQQYYKYFNEGKFEDMLGLLADNVVHEVNEGEAQTGIEKFRGFMKVMDAHYSEKVVDLVVFTSSVRDRFAAEFYIDGIYKKSYGGLPPAKNQKYKIRVGAFFETREGKISRVTNYYNLNAWIESVR